MLWRFRRNKPFIDSYTTSRDRQSNASPLFLEHPLHSSNKAVYGAINCFHENEVVKTCSLREHTFRVLPLILLSLPVHVCLGGVCLHLRPPVGQRVRSEPLYPTLSGIWVCIWVEFKADGSGPALFDGLAVVIFWIGLWFHPKVVPHRSILACLTLLAHCHI